MEKIATLLLLVFLVFGCQRQAVYLADGSSADGKYDIAVPIGGQSKLNDVLKTVSLLNSTVYYDTYSFSGEQQISRNMISPELLDQMSDQKAVIQDYSVGTATLIYHSNYRVAILTCAHVVDFPDTIFTYMGRENRNTPLESIAIRASQRNTLSEFRQGRGFEIIAIDRDLDIAILGKEFLIKTNEKLPVFNFTIGSAKELDWANFVYMIGYPSGKKMITRGIVSSPNRTRKHGFLIDALFNRGFSGGLVLAVRDGAPNYELVGIVNSVAADTEIVLAPQAQVNEADVDSNLPYDGPSYLRSQKKINYGISFGISIDAIQTLMEENRVAFENRGFDVNRFFK